MGPELVTDLLVARIGDRLGAQAGCSPARRPSRLGELGDLRIGGDVGVGHHLQPCAVDGQRPARAAELQAVPAGGRDLAARPGRHERRVLEDRLEHVRRLADAAQRVAPAHGGDRARELAGRPLDDVDVVGQEVGGLAARVVPEPAEVIHVPVLGRERLLADGPGEPGRDVPARGEPDAAQLADVAAADQIDAPLVVGARPLLGSDLDDATVMAGRLDHPPSLAHDVGQGLLHVDVLARRAGQHRHGRVPVVGGGDDHRVDVRPVQQLAEIAEAGGSPPRHGQAFLEPRRVDLADRRHLAVGLGQEIEQVALADEADADHPDAHPVVRAEHSARRGGGGQAGAGHGLQERAAGLHVTSLPGLRETMASSGPLSTEGSKRAFRSLRSLPHGGQSA